LRLSNLIFGVQDRMHAVCNRIYGVNNHIFEFIFPSGRELAAQKSKKENR